MDPITGFFVTLAIVILMTVWIVGERIDEDED